MKSAGRLEGEDVVTIQFRKLKACLPSKKGLEKLRADSELTDFLDRISKRVGAIVMITPSPVDLDDPNRWSERKGFKDMVDLSDVDVTRHAAAKFQEDATSLGLELPSAKTVREEWWDARNSHIRGGAKPLFDKDDEATRAKCIQIRTQLEGYLAMMGHASHDSKNGNGKAGAQLQPTNGTIPKEVATKPVEAPEQTDRKNIEDELSRLRERQAKDEERQVEYEVEQEELPKQIAELERQMDEKQEEIDKIITPPGSSKSTKTAFEKMRDVKDVELKKIKGELREKNAQQRTLPARVKQLEAVIGERKKKITELEEKLRAVEVPPPTPPLPVPVVPTPQTPPAPAAPQVGPEPKPQPQPQPQRLEPKLAPAPQSPTPQEPTSQKPNDLDPKSIESLAMALVGERAKNMISAAELESAKIIATARQQAFDILREAKEQRDTLLEEAAAKLRDALGIISQPPHAKPPRDPAKK